MVDIIEYMNAAAKTLCADMYQYQCGYMPKHDCYVATVSDDKGRVSVGFSSVEINALMKDFGALFSMRIKKCLEVLGKNP